MRLPSLRQAALVLLMVVLSVLFVARDVRRPPILYGDALGYYMYLPAVFIYHNPINFYELPPDKVPESNVQWQMNQLRLQGWRTELGYLINQYTYGVALLELPAFAAAHAWAVCSGGRANGFSPPYEVALRLLNALYALLGLIICYRILRRYFSEHISMLAVAALFLGTNLFWFSLRQAGMSHVPLFFLYAVLMWQSMLLYERPQAMRFLLIGAIVGVIVLIRPTDVVCIAIPLLYGVRSGATLRARMSFLWRHRAVLGGAVLLAALPAIPQLFYWKAVSGHWLYYSYGAQSFDWKHPHIVLGLTNGNNGWIAYTPLMLLALAGMLRMRREGLAGWQLCIFVLLPVYIYIIYAWYCWNYINGFGSRPMLHMYPLLALLLAGIFQWAARRKGALRAAMALLAVFFIAVNLSFTHLEALGKLNSEDSNWPFNLGMLFRHRMAYADLVTKDIAVCQPSNMRFVRTLSSALYHDSADTHYQRDTAHSGGFVYFMKDDENAPKQLKVAWTKDAFGDARWLRASGRFMFPGFYGLYEMHVLVLDIKRAGTFPLWKGIRIENKIGLADSTCPHWNTDFNLDHADAGRWGAVWAYVPLPHDMQAGDTIELNVWNPAKHELYLDDIKLELWR